MSSSAKLKKYLTDRKLTQADFARRLGVSQEAVSRYVTGKSTPTLQIAFRIARVTEDEVPTSVWESPRRRRAAA